MLTCATGLRLCEARMGHDEQLQQILDVVNKYLEAGTPSEALDRLIGLLDELDAIRAALQDDAIRTEFGEE